MRLSRTPSLILTGIVIALGLIAQDARAGVEPSGAAYETRSAQ